jgi:hypothetical protein
MPKDLDPELRKELAFTIQYALRLGRGRVRDMQKDLDDKKLDVVINALIEQLLLSNWRIERGMRPEPGTSMKPHLPPEGMPPAAPGSFKDFDRKR